MAKRDPVLLFIWWIPWLCLIAVLVGLGLLAACASWPTWLGGDATLSNPGAGRPDVLADPIGHAASWVRTILQWAVILGVVMLFPRPRAILWPAISFLWTVPLGKVRAKEAAKDIALAPLRLTGLVRESHAQRSKMKSKSPVPKRSPDR